MAEPRECVRCHRIRAIVSRELCNSCYSYERQCGDLSKYPQSNAKKKKRYDYCVDCGEYKHIAGRDKCKLCYQRWRMSQPGEKEKHAAKMRQDRSKRAEDYRENDRRRNKTDKRREWARQYQKEYYQKNPEAFKRSTRNWEDKNPGIRIKYKHDRRDRQSLLPSTLTLKEWEDVVKTYHYMCIYCGCTDRRLTQDHWIPVTKGGGYTKENIVPACQSCNSRKGTMTGEEFIELLDIQEWYQITEMLKKCAC